jgi:hypothetical protein
MKDMVVHGGFVYCRSLLHVSEVVGGGGCRFGGGVGVISIMAVESFTSQSAQGVMAGLFTIVGLTAQGGRRAQLPDGDMFCVQVNGTGLRQHVDAEGTQNGRLQAHAVVQGRRGVAKRATEQRPVATVQVCYVHATGACVISVQCGL